MKIALHASSEVSPGMMTALVLSAFTVSAGFGIVLPLLPFLLERLIGGGVTAAEISRHTGLLTGIYTLALFLFSPIWGQLSDRYGPRRILLCGLIGFGISMVVFPFMESLVGVYAERFVSGMFAAAVTPVVVAAVGDFITAEEERARRLAFISMAGITGFLLGPMLGVSITRIASIFLSRQPSGALLFPLVATAVLALIVALIVAVAVPHGNEARQVSHRASVHGGKRSWLMPKLLILSFIVSAGVGVFEVGLVLLGKQELGLTSFQIAMMFTECSLVMFVIQAVIFFSPWIRPNSTRWLINPAMGALATGLFLAPWATDFFMMLIVIGAVAASAGILSPILTYWISVQAGNAQGWELGRQTAASSLGMAAGSAIGGLLFNFVVPGASFIIAAGLTGLGLMLGWGLGHTLNPNDDAYSIRSREDDATITVMSAWKVKGR
ncbi:membrane protein [Novimethylophilus kurashikiensis]|uniref:Membrane protein n=1 Tax=Novimethylophilus kurashikiensis TaxID=1825523 RepID=A0A2R5FAC8_9PROT|nr:MFS transporter [Novimethylophilus kurashikiensis]GBG14779.1 membrane protein [Novimethylophilus kurashikiensis]